MTTNLEKQILRRNRKLRQAVRVPHVCTGVVCAGCVGPDDRPRLLVRPMTPAELAGRDRMGEAVLYDIGGEA